MPHVLIKKTVNILDIKFPLFLPALYGQENLFSNKEGTPQRPEAISPKTELSAWSTMDRAINSMGQNWGPDQEVFPRLGAFSHSPHGISDFLRSRITVNILFSVSM